MNNLETRRALDEVRTSITELDRALDAAADRAIAIGAGDVLERISRARAATKRGIDCLSELRKSLLGSNGHDPTPNARPESDRLFP
jgi:hypothetical protein